MAIGILAVAALLEGYSFHTVLEQSKRLKGTDGWWEFIRNSRVPEPPVVLLEDSAALIGLGLAFGGVMLTTVTGNPIWDAIGTLGIGVLLGGVETHSMLIGEGATVNQCKMIRSVLQDDEHVDAVIYLRTRYLAPDQLVVAAKVVCGPEHEFATAAGVIRKAEARIRQAMPSVRVVYSQPDIQPGTPEN